eukprot:INCI16938.1.p1 GENE.INCI16938.1~~INCI16938.1.p1  ORF type:complete len:578 (+),score=85.09 INCI16938.1:98-1831(+)
MAQSVEEVPPYEQVLLVKKAYIGELCKRKKRNLKRLNQVISPSIVKIVGDAGDSKVKVLVQSPQSREACEQAVEECKKAWSPQPRQKSKSPLYSQVVPLTDQLERALLAKNNNLLKDLRSTARHARVLVNNKVRGKGTVEVTSNVSQLACSATVKLMYTMCHIDPDVPQTASSSRGSGKSCDGFVKKVGGWALPPTLDHSSFKVPEEYVQPFRKELGERYSKMWKQQGITWRIVEAPASTGWLIVEFRLQGNSAAAKAATQAALEMLRRKWLPSQRQECAQEGALNALHHQKQHIVVVPFENVGRLVGKNGHGLAQLEQLCKPLGVSLAVEDCNPNGTAIGGEDNYYVQKGGKARRMIAKKVMISACDKAAGNQALFELEKMCLLNWAHLPVDEPVWDMSSLRLSALRNSIIQTLQQRLPGSSRVSIALIPRQEAPRLVGRAAKNLKVLQARCRDLGADVCVVGERNSDRIVVIQAKSVEAVQQAIEAVAHHVRPWQDLSTLPVGAQPDGRGRWFVGTHCSQAVTSGGGGSADASTSALHEIRQDSDGSWYSKNEFEQFYRDSGNRWHQRGPSGRRR